MARILYLAHDTPTPSGGVRTIYRHVSILRKHGLDAFVVHAEQGYRYPFATSDAPVLAQRPGLALRRDDVLVVPENFPLENLPQVPGLRCVVFLQSWSLAFQGLSDPLAWERLPVRRALCASELLLEFATDFLGLSEARLAPDAVDPLFHPRPKKLRIACMPRRMPEVAALIRDLFRLRHPLLRHVPWLEIDGVSEEEAAALLGESALFLCLGRLEGLGLPGLEALASGCLVTGFHGLGGREYARPDNGLWCGQEDVPDCVRKLGEAVDMLQRDDPRAGAMIEAGIRTAAAYTPERQERELAAIWDSWLRDN